MKDELVIIKERIDNKYHLEYGTKYLSIDLENIIRSIIQVKKIYSYCKFDNKIFHHEIFSIKNFYENKNENGIIFSQR